MAKGKLIRVGGKRKRVRMSDTELKILRKYSSILGLSEDKAAESLMLLGFEPASPELRVILNRKKITNDSDPDQLSASLDGAPKDYLKAPRQRSLNMALTKYPKEEDPIVVTLRKVSAHFGYSQPDFLKKIFFLFVEANVINGDGEPLVGDEPIGIFFLTAKKLKPYGWSTNPWNDLHQIKEKKLLYDFIGKGNFRHTYPITISYKEKVDDLLLMNIHFIEKAIFRDRSSFFQMLYCYFLRANGLLDRNFNLFSDWEECLTRIRILRLERKAPLSSLNSFHRKDF